MFWPTPQKLEGLCYVMPVTGHKAYTRKEEDDVELNHFIFLIYLFPNEISLFYFL
jgi:hypothetical protein